MLIGLAIALASFSLYATFVCFAYRQSRFYEHANFELVSLQEIDPKELARLHRVSESVRLPLVAFAVGSLGPETAEEIALFSDGGPVWAELSPQGLFWASTSRTGEHCLTIAGTSAHKMALGLAEFVAPAPPTISTRVAKGGVAVALDAHRGRAGDPVRLEDATAWLDRITRRAHMRIAHLLQSGSFVVAESSHEMVQPTLRYALRMVVFAPVSLLLGILIRRSPHGADDTNTRGGEERKPR